MKKFVIAMFICLIPVIVWSAEKPPSGTAQKEAEEDICFADQESHEAEIIFRRETGGSYRPGTRGGQLAREYEMKHGRVVTLMERYYKNHGKWFIPGPQSCARR